MSARDISMKRLPNLIWIVAVAALSFGADAQAQQRAQYEALVAAHARANLVPEELVHRVIVRESKYHPNLLGRGGAIGLMQIKLPTARGLGYTGDAAGLRDPETNLIYGIKYLAGAFRAAGGDHDRAVHYYASGYCYAESSCRKAKAARAEARRCKNAGSAVTGQRSRRCKRHTAALTPRPIGLH